MRVAVVFVVDLLGVVNEGKGTACVAESCFDLCLHGVQPSHRLGVGVASARESACGTQTFTRLPSARRVRRERWRERHVGKRRRAEKGISSFVRGLKREYEAWLCELGLLEVEESQSSG